MQEEGMGIKNDSRSLGEIVKQVDLPGIFSLQKRSITKKRLMFTNNVLCNNYAYNERKQHIIIDNFFVSRLEWRNKEVLTHIFKSGFYFVNHYVKRGIT